MLIADNNAAMETIGIRLSHYIAVLQLCKDRKFELQIHGNPDDLNIVIFDKL